MVGELSLEDRSALHSWSVELVARGELERVALLQRVLVALGARELEPSNSITETSERSIWSANNHGLDVNLNSDLAQTITTVKVSQVVDESACNAAADQGTAIRVTLNSVVSPSQHTTHTTSTAALTRANTLELPQRLGFSAKPHHLYVNRKTLLRTRFGVWLKHTNMMRWVLIIIASLLALVSMFLPLSTLVPEDGPLYRQAPDGSGVQELRIRRPGLFTWLSKQSLALIFWYLLMHHMNTEIFFSVLRTFEGVVIIGSFVIGEVAVFYNLFDTWGDAYLDREWIIFQFLDTLLVHLPCGVFLSTMDSWKVLDWVRGERYSSVKISLTVAAMAYFIKSFFDCKLEPGSQRWGLSEACVGELCVVPRDAFAAAECQMIIFCGKALLKYAMGWPFAFIRPRYDRHDAFEGTSVVGLVTDGNRTFRRRLWSMIRPQAGSAAPGGDLTDEPASPRSLGSTRKAPCKAPGQPAVG